jgi:hypothetical protein
MKTNEPGRKLIARVYADHAADMESLASASLTRAERKTLHRPAEADWL